MTTILTSPLILNKAKSVYTLWFKTLADFPKVYRYNLGGKIEECFLKILENIFITIYLPKEKKIDRLSLTIAELDRLKFFLQLAWENKCLATKHYAELSSRLEEVGRMLGGWKKGLEIKTPA